MSILIQNGQVIDPASGFNARADVAIQNDRILSIGSVDPGFKPSQTIDATGCMVVPGLVESNEILKNDIAQLRRRFKEDKTAAQKQIQMMESQGTVCTVCMYVYA